MALKTNRLILFLITVLSHEIISCNGNCDETVTDLLDAVASWYRTEGWHYIEIQYTTQGWYRMPPGNWRIPMIGPTNALFDNMWYYMVLIEELPATLGEDAKELQSCLVRNHISLNCIGNYSTVKIRICDERTQYYLPAIDMYSDGWTPYNFVQSDVEFLPPGLLVSVRPELVYNIEEDEGFQYYTPVLQFKCVPESNETSSYSVNWYIGNKIIKQVGPSNNAVELVLTEYDIEFKNPGFEVSCGVFIVNETTVSNETLSKPFYAGFEVSTKDMSVSKDGSATVEVRQTVPIGCKYSDGDTNACSTTLSLYDSNISENPCNAGISAVNADDDDMCVNEILAQKRTDVWDSDIVYTFRVSTIDNNYDDATDFDMRLEVDNNIENSLWQGFIVDNIHVNVVETADYKNKICYSHVDPHMRTCDGRYYENQKEGFYMLFHHKDTDVEVQEATKYCFGGNSGPVCACGIAVRAGKDVFMINRCGSINLLDFIRCDDGGIIQVKRINDYKYKIVTPTGTQIFANMHGGHYQNTMNIDIILSAKDVGKTEGLCGLCDGNPSNDFIRKDGVTASSNNDYKFSDSWRLTNDINLFTASKRILEGWATRNEVTCRCVKGKCTVQRRRECGGTVDSITKTKCDIHIRKKRALGDYKHQKEIDRLYSLMLTPRRIITKRSTEESTVTAEAANTACNESIYSAPAVVKFPNKTAGEDLGELMKQCVYDVEESNDTSWASVHVDAINTITKNILDLNPVYVANKTDEVEIFLTQTCSKNCSGNGICLETGECNCTSWFRGPDCSFDIRDPIIIEDVEGGGECDKANSTACTCYTIRAIHLFEGFSCKTTITRIHNSSEEIILTENAVQSGAYEDIYTGTCCITEEQNALSAENDFVHMYKFSASNDGNNFGDQQNVYVYDSTCHDININESVTEISLKGSFCFIDNQCHMEGELSYTGCQFCNSSVSAYNWTEYNQCLNGGTCIFQDSEYMCTCVDGYGGLNCEQDIDECVSIPCQNNGTCSDAVTGYTCNCSDGYEGNDCDTDIDDCASDPCSVGGVCSDHVNDFSCNCSDGYTGTVCETNIDECVSHPCWNGGTCVDQINGYNCTCVSGYEGVTCMNETDECASNPCQHGTCADALNKYMCTCMSGFGGQNCQLDLNECESEPCQHGGKCKDQVDSYTCVCTEGYNGTDCEIEIDECLSNPCQNGASCDDEVNRYKCTCVEGYEGLNCDTEIDECQSSPCQNGADCTDSLNGFTCTCSDGFEGINCEKETDECQSNPCQNGGTCSDEINGYKCICEKGFEGTHCETDIDECQSDPCQNGANCTDKVNGYNCTCIDGYAGNNCKTDLNECESEPCQHGSICKDQVDSYTCVCAEGYNGTDCELEIDECLTNPCQNGASCADQVNGYKCTCVEGYEGSNCVTETDECQSNPCQNGGNCSDEINGYKCICEKGFEGTHCETDIDECLSDPCQNGANCTDKVTGYNCTCIDGYTGNNCETDFNECEPEPCQHGGTCKDQVDSYICLCAEGYNGTDCEMEIDECQSIPCQNGADCINALNGYTCTCSDGYEGINCEKETDECLSNPCQNGGNCTDEVNGYQCLCEKGYEGTYCETDIDECQSHPCQNGANCTDKVKGYTCTCKPGYEGNNCETEIHVDECISNPCENGATCEDEINTYTCICARGYEGFNCETEIDECQSNPCQNGATCANEVNRYNCTCVGGYEGSYCETEIDECLSNPCQNGASCADQVNGYTCTCVGGYEGSNCGTEIDECQSNPCQNGATCTDEVNSYKCNCAGGYEGYDCDTAIPTTASTTKTNTVSVKRLPMQIVFPIDATDMDLSDLQLKQEIKRQIVSFYINLVGETFKRVSSFNISLGSLVVDFVAEYENNQQTSSDFTKANVDLVSGGRTMELLNKSVSATSFTVNKMTVTAETVKSDNGVCEIFHAINGDCPADQHCALASRKARCVEDDPKFGLLFVVVMILCAFAAFVLLLFIICFSLLAYRRTHQVVKHNKAANESKNSGSDSPWPYQTSIPVYSKTWGVQNKSFGYLSYPGEEYSEHQRQTYSKQQSNNRGKKSWNSRLSRHANV